LYLEERLFSWWAIGIGLLIEFFFVRWLFRLNICRAVLATLAANAVSALAGVVLIPLAGMAWEFFPGLLFYHYLNWGTFNPVTWGATFAIASLVTTTIEALVYRIGFKFTVRWREYGWLVVANAASVAVAFISLFLVPVRS
jgi:hypothetical protein